MPAELERYLFDLRGYLVLRNALDAAELRALNEGLDALLPLKVGEWHGYVQGHNYGDNDGFNLQQIYESGQPFERLIDHPSWVEHVKHFVGGEGTFDWHHGPVFIDENFANLRGPGEAIGLHSGGHTGTVRGIHFGHVSTRMLVAVVLPVTQSRFVQRYIIRGLTLGAVKG